MDEENITDFQSSYDLLQEQMVNSDAVMYSEMNSGDSGDMSSEAWQNQVLNSDPRDSAVFDSNEKLPEEESLNGQLDNEQSYTESSDGHNLDGVENRPLPTTLSFPEAPKRKLDDGVTSTECVDQDATGVDQMPEDSDGNEGPGPAKKALLELNVRKLLPELEKLWKPVDDNPNDFTAWTCLLQYVDHENELLAAREAYDGFLAKYPYCYGYWKKYADLEKRKGSADDCYQVFKRGLEAIPLSVDLWIHYLNYVKATNTDTDNIREQFKEAVATVGLEFRSDKLWEHYLQFEKDNGNLRKVLEVYDQIISTPTQSYAQHLQNLKDFINANAPEDILDEETFMELKANVEETVNAMEDTENKDESERTAIREKLIEMKSEIHKETAQEALARWAFEEGIKRPYFHVKALEKGQLKMWKEYLDFEIERGNEKRVLILFERCLIACCLYEEYWIKYVKYLQSLPSKDVNKIRSVFQRACTIHHCGKPWINLHWAAFEESEGNMEIASEILEKLESILPNSAHVRFRRINLERRLGNIPKCVELFEKYLAAEKNKSAASHVKIKFARFLIRFLNDYDKAQQLLEEAIEEDQGSKNKVLMALIDIGISRKPLDLDHVIETFDKALQSNLLPEQKLAFAHRKVEFLDDFGKDPSSTLKAQEDLQTISSQVAEKKSSSETSRTEDASKFSKPPTVAQQYGGPPPTHYPPPTSSVPPTAHHNGSASTDYQGQYGQYSAWNYQQPQTTPAYGYPAQQQSWNAYSGYQG